MQPGQGVSTKKTEQKGNAARTFFDKHYKLRKSNGRKSVSSATEEQQFRDNETAEHEPEQGKNRRLVRTRILDDNLRARGKNNNKPNIKQTTRQFY